MHDDAFSGRHVQNGQTLHNLCAKCHGQSSLADIAWRNHDADLLSTAETPNDMITFHAWDMVVNTVKDELWADIFHCSHFGSFQFTPENCPRG
ncbi:hypothetical protein GCM10022404_25370 [Celeribacter arenosi]|uniref:Uncharacterized protein n=1 Tax=Celeribacter arenosi TaxID=792649 RepID=A0ABP7KGN9_9RHOB